MKTGVIIGGSKGIGLSIYNNIKKSKKKIKIKKFNSKEIDTSNLDSVKKFIKKNNTLDLLVLNTAGPPPMDMFKIKKSDFEKYHMQLFYSFVLMLQTISIRKNGYVFLISSAILKEPPPQMVLSSVYRTAFLSFFKSYSKTMAKKNISCITIAPGSIKTSRIKQLVKNLKVYEQTLPSKKLGKPDDIGKFVKFVFENDIKYLNGSFIHFDGAISNFLF